MRSTNRDLQGENMNVIDHYDKLIIENNDPFRDPPELQDYMEKECIKIKKN